MCCFMLWHIYCDEGDMGGGAFLFHHQTSTCIENVKFREVNVDLLPGTSSGK